MATLKVEQQFFFRHIKVDMKKKEIFFLENSFGPDLAQAFKVLFLSHVGGFQLVDLIIAELENHMTCYNSMPLIG